MASSGPKKTDDVTKDTPDGPPPAKKLPPSLQRLVDEADREGGIYDEIWSGTAPESTESNIRYAAYATRIRTALLSAQRYVAYTSDIGESFRPVAHPNLVRAAYGISWAYLTGDVAHEGYKAYWANQRVLNPPLVTETETAAGVSGATTTALTKPGVVSPLEDYRTVMVQRALFQSVASMGLPMLTIHSIVKYTGRAMRNVKSPRLRMWGPVGLGLSVVPALPYLFDEPVEAAVEYAFHAGFRAFGGVAAVGESPSTGREHRLEESPLVADGKGKGGKPKEKEL